MKKKLIFIGALFVMFISGTMLYNINAKADGQCDNINGYKAWYLSGLRAEQFYDCCYTLREGYSPHGACSIQQQ